MPLLKREADLFPQDLFDLSVERHPWWVALVKSRQEKALARHLLPLGIPYYLPQREQKIRRAGRNFVSYLPLFPGYLFFRSTSFAVELDREAVAPLAAHVERFGRVSGRAA